MHKIKPIFLIITAAGLIIFVIAELFLNGIIFLNNPSKIKYLIRGVDVSSYQGNIEWGILSRQNIDFAFIKATEGSNFTDSKFKYNWSNAAKTNLKIGAYHFFSFDSDGDTQADNFIKTVPKQKDMLPPVIDIELYGKYFKEKPDKKILSQLNIMINRLYRFYGKKPIIYTTSGFYNLYIGEGYKDCHIWIRNIISEPHLQGRSWTFWQYSDRKILKGYSGKEKFIDLNVFNGTKEDLDML